MINELQLELTTRCNSNCIMCPRSHLKEDRRDKDIDFDFAKEVIDKAYELGARMIKPQWYGESTLHKDWLRIISYAKDKGYKVIVYTNGSLLDEEKRNIVLDKDIDEVIFSIDSFFPSEYEKIRRGLRISKILLNLLPLRRDRDERNSKTKIIVSGVELGEGNTRKMKEYFNKLTCDEVRIVNKIDFDKKIDKPKDKIICPHNVGGRLIVGVDGRCYLCCHDWLGEYYIGDLRKQIMEEILNSDLRKNFINNLEKLDICQRCY